MSIEPQRPDPNSDEARPDMAVDAFIDASGAPEAVARGVAAISPAGCSVLVGMGAATMELPVQVIQSRELTLAGVFRYASTWPTAIALIRSRLVDLDGLVTARYPLEKTADALESDRVPGTIKSSVQVTVS